MLKSDYEVDKASEEVKEAMRDRCHEQSHEYENCCYHGLHCMRWDGCWTSQFKIAWMNTPRSQIPSKENL